LAAVELRVTSAIDPAEQADIAALVARRAAADGHPALPEPQRMAVVRPDLGAQGVRALLARRDGTLVGLALLTPAADGSTELHVVFDPALGDGGDAGDEVRHALVGQAAAEAPASGPLRLWAMRATKADDEAAHRSGFSPDRDLLQMQVPLPLPTDVVEAARPVATRPFVPGQDEAAWLDVNNRAFAGHPEQGAWTMDQLQERLAAAWVQLDGFLIADDPDGSGLIGSCWTKVPRPAKPLVGEIYVISVAPERSGQGWGRALTVAGLVHMAAQGVTVGMLYTDASNTTAVALYRSLGFTVDHVDRSYLRPPGAGDAAAAVS
jgi:mycothiol synthase